MDYANKRTVPLRTIKSGEFFRRRIDAKTTFVRGDYDRTDKKFEAYDFEDINRFVYLKGATPVFVEFEF
jgi:hypothetical protein